MVANPYAFVSSDSSAAVQIGSAMRERMDRIVGRDFSVITREQMNDALESFGYPADAILNPVVQRQFASTVGARTYLNSTLARTNGTVRLTSRLVGLNDEAGRTVVVSGSAGNLASLGQQSAEQFEPTVDALEDARKCINLSASEPEEAADAARNALETDPLNGLAWYCLAEMAIKDSVPGDSIIALLENVVEGDSLSLNAWTLLAAQHEAAGDTAKVVAAFQEMIQIAPTNEELRKRAFQYFIQAGRTEAARAAVEEAIRTDPYNPDNYDLLSNVCIFESNYTCAVDALEQAYTIDSTKADSTFYMKITVTAAQQPDTTRLLKWA
ncbi:MAG: tetratricopeptide repeat protein, partial [Gemmatimonadales bacterium]